MDKSDLKIAIVDDHIDMVTSLSNYLEGNGIKTVWAYTSDDAIKLCKKEHPNLLIIDDKVDGISCIEVARSIPEQKVLIMVYENKDNSKAKNIIGSIDKPVDSYELVQLILKIFNAH